MEQGILAFSKWLGSVERKASELEDLQALDYISIVLKKVLGVQVYFVETLGKRLSYVAGIIDEYPIGFSNSLYNMTDKVWMVSEDLVFLSDDRRRELLSFLKRFISGRESFVVKCG